MKLSLPVPTSTNRLHYKNGSRTKEYKAWLKAAGWMVQIQARGAALEPPVSVALELPRSCGMDLDNALKATMDLLVRHKVMPDDRQEFVDHIELDWHEGDQMQIRVTRVKP